MKNFENPVIEIKKLELGDVITTSVPTPPACENDTPIDWD